MKRLGGDAEAFRDEAGFLRAVECIAQDRMSGRMQMDADLVCPAGLEAKAEDRHRARLDKPCPDCFVIGDGALAVRSRNAKHFPLSAPFNRHVEGAGGRLQRAADKSEILLFGIGGGKSFGCTGLHVAVFCEQDNAGGVPVQAVDGMAAAAARRLQQIPGDMV